MPALSEFSYTKTDFKSTQKGLSGISVNGSRLSRIQLGYESCELSYNSPYKHLVNGLKAFKWESNCQKYTLKNQYHRKGCTLVLVMPSTMHIELNQKSFNDNWHCYASLLVF